MNRRNLFTAIAAVLAALVRRKPVYTMGGMHEPFPREMVAVRPGEVVFVHPAGDTVKIRGNLHWDAQRFEAAMGNAFTKAAKAARALARD